MTFTNTTTESEPFSFEKMLELIKTLPKPQEFWSWKMAPINMGWGFEDAKSKVTITHPDVWARARRQKPELFTYSGPYGFGGVRIIEIDDDSDLARACRKRFSDTLLSGAEFKE